MDIFGCPGDFSAVLGPMPRTIFRKIRWVVGLCVITFSLTSREGPPLQGATSPLRPTCHYSETDAARITKLAMDVGEVKAISQCHSIFTSQLRPPRSVGVEFYLSCETVANSTKLATCVPRVALIPKLVLFFLPLFKDRPGPLL